MIKKIIAFLTICFIITGIISPVFCDASALPQPNWSDPGISEIINISDLTGWMLNGGTFDVSTYTDAESFMNDYYNSRTRTRLVSPNEDPLDDYYEVLPGFGINNQFVPGDSFARPLDTNRVIASSFRDHSGYGRRLSNEVNEALLSSGSFYDTKIPLLNEIEFANFVGYNHDALNLYKQSFNISEPTPTPNPDPNYSYISNINSIYAHDFDGGSNIDFFSPNIYYTDNNATNFVNFVNGNSRNYSFFANYDISSNHINNSSIGNTLTLFASSIVSINVNELENNTVSVEYTNLSPITLPNLWNPPVANNNFTRTGFVYHSSHNGFQINWYSNDYTPTQTTFSSLSDAINYIYQHYTNINLYVNGELWAIAGSNSNIPTITPEFPDAVGGEELSSTTWPIFRPRAPYYTNLPGVLQAIEDAIADDGELDIDDLKPYLTDENGDPVPDPIFDPEPVPIPVPDPVNPDVVPGLPVLPAMPPEMPGFNGVSVLAEIINFTNQSLPTSLIVTFWGIVFGIVILGLIKILHK